MYILDAEFLMQDDELRQARKLLAWQSKYEKNLEIKKLIGKSPSPAAQMKYEENKTILTYIVKACLLRELNLKLYAVIRYVYWHGGAVEFLIKDMRILKRMHSGLSIYLHGCKLRQDGNIGVNPEYAHLNEGIIQRRLLDGSWHSIIPKNPFWVNGS